MLVFPQLTTGAATMYPVVRKSNIRTVVNELADGSRVTHEDVDAATLLWKLQLKGLILAEWNAVEALFTAAQGRLNTFTFLDPVGNLLARSEEFGDPVWTNGAAIQLTAGATDPFGSTRATRVINTCQAAQGVTQTLAAPGNYQYALSAWARTDGNSSLTLNASAGSGSVSKDFVLDTQWRRISLFVALAQTADSVTFGAQLSAGASVQLFGMQVEAQLAPSDYKKNGARGGVISNARFASDQLTVRAQGTDVFDAVIGIVNAGD